MPRSRWVTAETNLRFSHHELLHGCALHDSIADPISDERCTIRPAFTAEPSKRYPDGSHHINTKHLNDFFLKILTKLKIPTGRKDGFTIHSLRHFMRTFCVNAGVPERVVDLWLGHASDRRSVQSTYYHLTDEASQQFMRKVPFGEGNPAADAGE